MYPDFIGIGAQKAGTTWLHRNLQLHPQIWMPEIKELHYFDKRIDETASIARKVFGSGSEHRRWRQQVGKRIDRQIKRFSPREALWDLRYYFGSPGDGWYASLFEPGAGKVVGEITPAYSMLDPARVSRVREIMPEAKIMFMMRNPLERAWSQAVMHFSRAEDLAADSVAPERLRRHFDGEGSRSRTDYLRTLENWGRYYPPERIFVGFLEQTWPRIAQRGAAAEHGRTDLLTMCATLSCAKNVRNATHQRPRSGMNTPEHGNLMDGLNAGNGKRGGSHGIHEAGKHRNGRVSNLPRLHGVRERGTLDSQVGA